MSEPDRAVFCLICRHGYPVAGEPDLASLGWHQSEDAPGNMVLSEPLKTITLLPGPGWVCAACVKAREDFRKEHGE